MAYEDSLPDLLPKSFSDASLSDWKRYRASLVALRIDGEKAVTVLHDELERIGTSAPKSIREPARLEWFEAKEKQKAFVALVAPLIIEANERCQLKFDCAINRILFSLSLIFVRSISHPMISLALTN
jgi:hypothetical protein